MSLTFFEGKDRHLQVLFHLLKGAFDLVKKAKDNAAAKTTIIVVHLKNLLESGNLDVAIAKIGRQIGQACVTLGRVRALGMFRGASGLLTSSSAMINIKSLLLGR